MLQPYTDSILTDDLPEHGLRRGDIGTVVERHERPDGAVGYTIEFFDLTGRTVSVVTVDQSRLRTPTAFDIPNVRRRTG